VAREPGVASLPNFGLPDTEKTNRNLDAASRYQRDGVPFLGTFFSHYTHANTTLAIIVIILLLAIIAVLL